MNAAPLDCGSVSRSFDLRKALGGTAVLCLFSASLPAVADLIPKQNPMQGRGILVAAPGPAAARVHDVPKQNPGQGRSVPPAPLPQVTAPAPVAFTALVPVAPVATPTPAAPVAPAVVSAPVAVAVPSSVPVTPRAPSPLVVQGGGGGGQPVQGAGSGWQVAPMALPPASAPTALGEVLPRTDVLVSSMKGVSLPDMPPDGLPPVTTASSACVNVTLSPDERRAHRTLVDLTGDGLIVTPVETAHIRQVLVHAGLTVPQADAAGRHCLPQSVVRDLIKSGPLADRSQQMALVQTRSGWQLAPAVEKSVQDKPVRAATGAARTKVSTKKAPAVRSVALLRPASPR